MAPRRKISLLPGPSQRKSPQMSNRDAKVSEQATNKHGDREPDVEMAILEYWTNVILPKVSPEWKSPEQRLNL